MKFHLLLFILIGSSVFAQDKSIDKSSIETLTFSEVVKVDSLITSNELFFRAQTWFVDMFKNSKEVIQLADKENGKIIGKGSFDYNSRVFSGSETTKGLIRFTIIISLKSGRYKYEFTDFIHEGNKFARYGDISFGLITTSVDCPKNFPGKITGKKWKDNVWYDIKSQINTNINPLKINLIQSMEKVSMKSGEDDW